MDRLNITLDDEHGEKLARLAERTHVQPGTLARSQLGLSQARRGQTVRLDEL